MTVKQNSKIIFLGTPVFAACALETLSTEGYEIIGVFTQPDRPSGRGKHISSSPVKELAERLGLPIFQPENKKQLTEQVLKLNPDVAVVAAYGIIIEKDALDVPKYGFLNIHGSLLPKYRGASPISEAILQGDDETGITIMHMDAGMDTGAIIQKFPLPVLATDTTQSLTDRMAKLGAQAITEVLPQWIEGKTLETPQEETQASYCHKLSKEDAHIDWNETADLIERKIRAYFPWPGAYTFTNKMRIKILKAALTVTPSSEDTESIGIISYDSGHLYVTTGNGTLELLELQPEGKNPMTAAAFINGNPKLDHSKLT